MTHCTNLTTYRNVVEGTEKILHVFPQSHMKQILQSDMEHILRLMDTLQIHHRHARSINLIGTALKYIGGTPDFDDFNEVKFREKALIESNERQFTINTKIQVQINQLTDTVNQILRTTKESKIDTGNLFGLLTARNRAVITDLENIIYSIVLGKVNIVNPIILDTKEISKILITELAANVSISDIII